MDIKKWIFFFCGMIILVACSQSEDINTPITPPTSPPAAKKHLTEKDLESTTYKFELIFHFLQNDKSKLSRVHTSNLQAIIDIINKYYAGNISNNTDAKVMFSLADSIPTNMTEKGITRTTITEDSISYNTLINEKPGKKFYDIGWDRSRYINIYVYTTKEENIGGVSTMPKMPKAVAKDGDLIASGNEFTSYNASITLQETLLDYWLDYGKNLYADVNPANVLAHELGHYLGLYHCYHSTKEKEDYCDDTKEYDRDEYMKTFEKLKPKIEAAKTSEEYRDIVDTLFWRRAISDASLFRSDNIMDYYYTKANKFTPDQVRRIRRHLYYSTTIPGPKVYLATKASRALITRPSKPYIMICPI